jgi:hypothetical protein
MIKVMWAAFINSDTEPYSIFFTDQLLVAYLFKFEGTFAQLETSNRLDCRIM